MANSNDTVETLTALDVVRCVYLALVAHERGDLVSARRWQAKADAWLRASVPPTDLSPVEEEAANSFR